jgi:hypothetical protein
MLWFTVYAAITRFNVGTENYSVICGFGGIRDRFDLIMPLGRKNDDTIENGLKYFQICKKTFI